MRRVLTWARGVAAVGGSFAEPPAHLPGVLGAPSSAGEGGGSGHYTPFLFAFYFFTSLFVVDSGCLLFCGDSIVMFSVDCLVFNGELCFCMRHYFAFGLSNC